MEGRSLRLLSDGQPLSPAGAKYAFRHLDVNIDAIRSIVARSVGGRYLRGSEEVYAAAILPVTTAQRHIRTLISGKVPKAPKAFGEAVAHRLKNSLKTGAPVTFDVIFAVDFKELPPNFCVGVEERINLFRREKVEHLVSLSVVDTNQSVTFDILLIDENHAFVSIPTVSGLSDVQTSIEFEGHPALVRDLVTWFDKRVRQQAEDYWRWSKRIGSGAGTPRSAPIDEGGVDAVADRGKAT